MSKNSELAEEILKVLQIAGLIGDNTFGVLPQKAETALGLIDEKLSGVREAVGKIAKAYGGRIQTKVFDPKADTDDFGNVIALMDEAVITMGDLAAFAQLYESLKVD